MRKHGVRRLIFSSSCTVYGVPQYLPLDEDHPTGQRCTNPYGRTKYFIEEVLKDLSASEKVPLPMVFGERLYLSQSVFRECRTVGMSQ